MVKNLATILLVASVSLLGIHPVASHHSRDAYFDVETTVEFIDAIAVSFKLVNPHSQLVFMAKDEKGNDVEWTAAIHAASNLRRAGIRESLIGQGDKLTVSGSPSRGDRNVMWLDNIVLANGDVADFSFAAIIRGEGLITSAGEVNSN
jgi:hypothetical protein